MSTAGPNSTATGANDSSVGTVDWNNPGNVAANDNTYAGVKINSNGTTSHYLKATNAGFSIPAGATINGIVVEVKKYTSVTYSGDEKKIDNAVRIVKGGTIGSTDRADGTTPWPNPTDPGTYVSYGSSSDLWGESWTPSDINASTFGFAISVKTSCSLCGLSLSDNVFIDHIRITVYYTPAATGSGNMFQVMDL